ncbi:MAG: hypothetical protein Q9170_004227 [Blastenia crenularia]
MVEQEVRHRELVVRHKGAAAGAAAGGIVLDEQEEGTVPDEEGGIVPGVDTAPAEVVADTDCGMAGDMVAAEGMDYALAEEVEADNPVGAAGHTDLERGSLGVGHSFEELAKEHHSCALVEGVEADTDRVGLVGDKVVVGHNLAGEDNPVG